MAYKVKSPTIVRRKMLHEDGLGAAEGVSAERQLVQSMVDARAVVA